jgi:hypothetical protein
MEPGMLTSLLGRVAINREGLKRIVEQLAKEKVFILLPESCCPAIHAHLLLSLLIALTLSSLPRRKEVAQTNQSSSNTPCCHVKIS